MKNRELATPLVVSSFFFGDTDIMRFKLPMTVVVVIGSLVAVAVGAESYREISLSELRDRIQGGWAGQMIGVSYGAPTEFRSRGKILEGDIPVWTPDRVSNTLGQDDLYVDMTFAKVIDEKGLRATTADFGAMFRDARYSLWHANLAARRALKRGVPAGKSGMPRYNAHANDIDFQIEADFIGLMAPGMPRASNALCDRVGRVMNYGDGLYGGMFVSGMYSAAYFESDMRKVVEAGLACIPLQSPYGQLIADVLSWSRQYPDDWKKSWQLIEDKWDKREPCPNGALNPFNIDAKINGAYIALGLLYGNRDFARTLEIATRAGQDSDCNPSSAAGILGVSLGYRAIPDHWKSGIPAIAEQKFQFTDFSFQTICQSTEKQALALAKQQGGRIEDQQLKIKLQTPQAPKLQIWDDYGSPVERVAATDARWSWKGDWKASGNPPGTTRTARDKGAEAAISFEGTGAIVVGPYLPTGGKLEATLDGRLERITDVYSDENSSKGGEAVWHVFRLKPGKHTLRLTALGQPFGDSKGSDVAIEALVIFR